MFTSGAKMKAMHFAGCDVRISNSNGYQSMDGKQAATMVRRKQKYLMHIVGSFKPEQGDFRPVDGMMSVAQQIRHIAFTVTWFREGVFGAGFDMDFEKLEMENRRPVTLGAARQESDETYADYTKFLESLSETDLSAPMSPNAVFGEAPKVMVIGAGADHAAHRRGALRVYLRLPGITPVMVYTE